jgi:hypothetical protein
VRAVKQESLDHTPLVATFRKVDINQSLGEELIQFIEFEKHFHDEYDSKKCSIERFYLKLIIGKRVQHMFPNFLTILRIYLTMLVTNCSGERSFSKLKLIFHRLRMSMTHSHMKRLVLMSIECDLLRKIDFSELILDFANRKIRKVAVV